MFQMLCQFHAASGVCELEEITAPRFRKPRIKPSVCWKEKIRKAHLQQAGVDNGSNQTISHANKPGGRFNFGFRNSKRLSVEKGRFLP
jgi:hypothetical protein